MIKSTFEESHDQEWIKKNITAPVHELVILRQVIPWSEIITRLASFYDPQKGCYGKSLRILVALLLVSRLRQLSDEQVVIQTKENRYIQYFCNVPDNGLQTFLDASTLCKFRKRIGENGGEHWPQLSPFPGPVKVFLKLSSHRQTVKNRLTLRAYPCYL